MNPLSQLSRPSATALALVVAVAGSLGLGCRGGVSEDPPVHLVLDMDFQQHRRPQSISSVFKDHRAARPVDPHAVARGKLKIDTALHEGKDASGQLVERAPVEVDQVKVERGRERYNIYCAPCHDGSGSGNGIVPQRSGGAFAGMPDFRLDRLVRAPDGELFNTITNGKGRMSGYGRQIPAEDRWAIVTWLRVLQTMEVSK